MVSGPYVFVGKIAPAHVVLPYNISQTYSIRITENPKIKAEISFTVNVNITYSNVLVIFSDVKGVDSIAGLRNLAINAIDKQIDAAGFCLGGAFSVEVIAAYDPNVGNNGLQYKTFDHYLIDRSKVDNDPVPYPWVQEYVLKPESVYLVRAYRNLRGALSNVLDTGFFCFRAIESIRQAFVLEQDNRKTEHSWNRLRTALRVDRSYLKEIEEFALEQRHGGDPTMTAESQRSVVYKAWAVTERYTRYLYNGSTQLPENFPVLVETQ